MLHLLEFEDTDFLIKSGVDTGLPQNPDGTFPVEYYVNQERVSREDFVVCLDLRKTEMQSVVAENGSWWIGLYHSMTRAIEPYEDRIWARIKRRLEE